MPENKWKFRIEDILGCMERATNYTRDMAPEDFETDEMAFDAVEQNLIAIGEAAKHVSADVREAHSEVLWGEFMETGNMAMHRYFERSPHSTWKAVKQDIPRLAPKLRRILESEG